MALKGLILTDPSDRSETGGLGRELFPVANKPILLHAVEAMCTGGIRDVAVCVTRRRRALVHETIRAAASGDGRCVEVIETEAQGPIAGILAASDFLGDAPFLVQLGDGLLQDDIEGLAHDACDTLDALVLVHRLSRQTSRQEPPAGASAATLGRFVAQAGAQAFGGGFVPTAVDQLYRHRRDEDFTALTDSLRRSGARVDVRMVRGWQRYAGDASELLEMNRALLDQIDGQPDGSFDTRTRIEGRVSIHPTAVIEASVIRGPAIIGPGARVSHSFVGPYTSLGPDVWLEGAEVEHSIVLEGAQILHVGGRLEASVIGFGTRVVKDFSLPRSLRMQLGPGALIQL